MREFILIDKIYLKFSTTWPLHLIHFAYLVLIFCNRKLLESTARHLFLHTLPTWHLFCSRKILRMPITTARHRGFGLIAPCCWACRHYVFCFFPLLLKYSFNVKYKKVLQKQSRIIVFSEITFSKNS